MRAAETAFWIFAFFALITAVAFWIRNLGKQAAAQANDFKEKMDELDGFLENWSVNWATYCELETTLREISQHPQKDRKRIADWSSRFYYKYRVQARSKYVKKN